MNDTKLLLPTQKAANLDVTKLQPFKIDCPTFITTYSCRTSELMLQKLQQIVHSNFRLQYPDFYQFKYIN